MTERDTRESPRKDPAEASPSRDAHPRPQDESLKLHGDKLEGLVPKTEAKSEK